MNDFKRFYPAKLLLFGEHTVLKGSSSIAIPYDAYRMQWKEKKCDHPQWLTEYTAFLSATCQKFLDIEVLSSWLLKNTIESNIPIGYGLGSSGALTAAIYDICIIKREHDNLEKLQKQLGIMESFFHGQSSGFDPLISYCNFPIMRTTKGLKRISQKDINFGLNCYLLDSSAPRSGSQMINTFLEKYENCKNQMMKLGSLNDQAINNIIGKSTSSLLDIIQNISQIQLENMDYMIVSALKKLWEQGLKTDAYYLKVCGAGGGGFYFLFSEKKLNKCGPYTLQKVFSPRVT